MRALDKGLLRLLRTRGHSPRIERAVVAYTNAGEHGLLWQIVAAIGALADKERRPAYLHAMRTVLAAYGVNTAIKYVVRRPRPVLEGHEWLVDTTSGYTYPSAHTAMAFAAARTLPLPRSPLYAAAVAMAISRPYVGVHYPSDALAGAALGEAVARLVP
jgi:undecaprenyl-diphosphatase